MKTPNLTLKQERQKKMMLALPFILIPFLTLLFWSLGGGKDNPAQAQQNTQKGFNAALPDAKLKKDSTQNKMSYYDKAAKDSDKLKQQMKTDPYYHGKADTDTSALHFPRPGQFAKRNTPAVTVRSSHLMGTGGDAKANEAQVYQKLAALQSTINKPENGIPSAASPVTSQHTASAGSAVPSTSPLPTDPYASPLKNQTAPQDPQLTQMNSLLDKILDIQHPDRIKTVSQTDSAAAVTRFKAIPAIIDGKQKITEGSVVRIRLLDTVTLSGQFIPKGQLIYGKGLLYNQRLTLNLKIIRIGRTILPVDLTVFDMTDGLEGVNVPEAVTGDAVKDGAASGVQGMEFMTLDPSMTAQLAGAGVNTAKGLFSKKVKRIKAKLKDGHPLLIRVNKRNS